MKEKKAKNKELSPKQKEPKTRDCEKIVEAFIKDIRYGIRSLLRRPGFTAIAVITLALGIGATTAIFSVVNAVLLRPLPYPEPDRLVYVKEDLGSGELSFFASSKEFVAWKNQSRTLSQIAGYLSSGSNLTGGDQAERVICGTVTASFFPLLGVQPVVGRNFLPEDDRPDGTPVAILSHALWQRRFGGDRAVIGKVLALDSRSYTVIGVLPPTFQIPDRYAFQKGNDYDVWIPFSLSDTDPKFTLVRVIGRLKPGVSTELARAELDTILQSNLRKGRTKHVVLAAWQEEIAGGVRRSLLFFLAAAGFVLLIACVNVANLLLSLSATREREMAVRLALGAGRPRIIRQLLTESILLSVLGAMLGLALAFWGKDLLVAFISINLPTVGPIGIDYRVLGFTVGLALFTGLLFGLAPALQASSVRLNEWLKEGGRGAASGRSRHRLRNALVVVEVALAMVVLIGAGLLLKSFLRLRGINSGYRSEGVLSLTVDLASARYPDPKDQSAFFQQVLERVKGLGGVQSAAATSSLPLGSNMGLASIAIEGRPEATSPIPYAAVSPDYFQTLGIPLLRGRSLGDFDREGSPGVIIVNESFARHYFPNENCLGRRVGSWVRKNDWMTIVGVVADIRDDLEQEAAPEMYASYLQAGEPSMYLVVRAAGDPMNLAAGVRSQIAGVDKDQPPYDLMTLDERRAESLNPRRVNTLLLGAFAALALVLGAIGIYGVVSYSVSRRTHELGIRMALGARQVDVLSLVVRQCLVLVVSGEVLGLAAALALNRVMSNLVFQITTTDPLTYAGVALAWTMVALLACYIPARRATKVDPLGALRYE